MLMIGTKNCGRETAYDKPEDVVKGIRRILDVIAEKQPQTKTLLLPIFVRGNGPDHPGRKRNDAANAAIKAFADGDKVIWVDFNAKYLDKKGDTKWIMPDRLHPNAAGYKIWTEAVLPSGIDTVKFVSATGERKRSFVAQDDGLYALSGFVIIVK